MLRKRITTVGNSAALVISRDLLQLMELEVGDEVEIAVADRTMTLRPVREPAPETTDETPFISPIKRAIRVTATYRVGGRIAPPPVDEDTVVYFDE
jgi:antitoxin component of MazEF toxin-antitoxin module